MLFPKKVKHRKWHTMRKNPNKARVSTRGLTLAFGSYGLKTVVGARIRASQIEAARKAISRAVSKKGKMWTRVFPDKPYTQKAAEVGMGKGKGDVQGYEFEALPGRMLFEVDGITEVEAKDAMRKAGSKLPMKTRFVSRVI